MYDPLDPDRSDLDAYGAMVDEFGARRVVDLGCGTGTLACLLAGRGVSVVGVDPAAASLAVARRKPHAEKVRWVHGDAGATAGLAADLVTMTGNVAQVFVTDDDWHTTLRAIRTALRTGGRRGRDLDRPDGGRLAVGVLPGELPVPRRRGAADLELHAEVP